MMAWSDGSVTIVVQDVNFMITGICRWIRDVKRWGEVVFSGHFGPVRVGAIFVSIFAHRFLEDSVIRPSTSTGGNQENNQIELVRVIAFMVLCSIAIHGLFLPGFSLGKTRVQYFEDLVEERYEWEWTRTGLDEPRLVGWKILLLIKI